MAKKRTPNIFWHIKSVHLYKAYLRQGIGKTEYSKELISNISYNIQYLEFLNSIIFNPSEIHSVVWTQSLKSFVITGMGIIEAILYHRLKSKNKHKTNSLKEVKRINSSEVFKEGEKRFTIETIIYEKLDEPVEEEMTFKSMLNKASALKLLGTESSFYGKINTLNKLRNRVHLHIREKDYDTDWNNFKRADVILMKEVLHTFLKSAWFRPNYDYDQLFDFLTNNDHISIHAIHQAEG